MKELQIRKFLTIGFVILLISSCVSSETTINKDSYKTPCNARVVMKIENSELKNLEFLGTCQSSKTAGGFSRTKNRAMEDVIKCACEKGGDLIEVTKNKETQVTTNKETLHTITGEGPPTYLIDEIFANIYRRKVNEDN
jgi:hypothetical protein